MTLENMLRQHLNDSEPGGFYFHAGGWNVTLSIDVKDKLSCSLNELALEKNETIAEALKPWAVRIADRATGLLEPLRLLEVDLPLGKAMLRSETPTVRDGKSYYYELLLVRGERASATLRRYAGDRQHGEKRETVPFVLTNDTIVKLVTDIVGGN